NTWADSGTKSHGPEPGANALAHLRSSRVAWSGDHATTGHGEAIHCHSRVQRVQPQQPSQRHQLRQPLPKVGIPLTPLDAVSRGGFRTAASTAGEQELQEVGGRLYRQGTKPRRPTGVAFF